MSVRALVSPHDHGQRAQRHREEQRLELPKKDVDDESREGTHALAEEAMVGDIVLQLGKHEEEVVIRERSKRQRGEASEPASHDWRCLLVPLQKRRE